MGYVRDGAVVLDKHVEPVRVKVPGHHAAGLDDARLLRELCLAECLEKGEFVRRESGSWNKRPGLPFRTKAPRRASCRPACWSTPASCRCPCCRRSLRERREACWASFVGSEYVLLWKYTAVLFWTASEFFAWANARCWDSSCFKLKRARGLQLDDDVAPARSARHVTRSPAF